MAYIYGLVDPITNELRYIGYTNENNPKVRRDGHWKERNRNKRTHKRNWIKSLFENCSIKPEIFIIEEIESEQWTEAETFWIEYFKSIGCKLTNEALGGLGKIKGSKVKQSQKDKVRKTLKRMFEEGTWRPTGAPKGNIPWNKGIEMDYYPNGGKVAKGIERPWQDGEARQEHRRKEYIFVDPSGGIHEVKGLRKFCREYNLHPGNMSQVAKGNLGSYKGWTTLNR